jgi:Sigma-70, region 4
MLMRLHGDMTQEQIGQQLRISQMHVSRLLARALGYLRPRLPGLPGRASGTGLAEAPGMDLTGAATHRRGRQESRLRGCLWWPRLAALMPGLPDDDQA